MNGREPHHYCGFLILLLSMLSAFAWAYFPPVKNPSKASLVIRNQLQNVEVNQPASQQQIYPEFETAGKKIQSGIRE